MHKPFRLCVRVVADLPGVGQNLQNHPFYKMMYTCHAPVMGYSHVRPLGAVKAGLDYILARRGPLARGLFPTTGLFRVEPGDHGLIQVCLAPALVIRRKSGVLGILPQEHGFTLLINQGIPRSTGRVRLVSADPATRPAIEPDCFSDPADLRTLAKGAAHLRDMMDLPPLRDVIADEIQPEAPPHGIDDLIEDIRNSAATHYHGVGTCRMARDPMAVVGADLKVHGVEGLRVADASVMPRIINGNTFAATVMIAERAVDFITGLPQGRTAYVKGKHYGTASSRTIWPSGF